MSSTRITVLCLGLFWLCLATCVALLVATTPKLNHSDAADEEMRQTLKKEYEQKSMQIGKKAFQALDQKYGTDSDRSYQWSY
jgi:hypothetical protein